MDHLYLNARDLDFHAFETATALLACIMVAVLLHDGKSHWLKGAILVMCYVIIAAAFWFHPDPEDMAS